MAVRKGVVSACIVIFIGMAVFFGYVAYERAMETYPVRVFEAILKKNLVSSTTYKRLEYSVREDMKDREVYVRIKFNSQNRMGALIDSEALMILIPEHVYLQERFDNKEIGIRESKEVIEMYKNFIKQDKKTFEYNLKEGKTGFFYENFRIRKIIVDDLSLDKIKILELNEILESRGAHEALEKNIFNKYPFKIPNF